MKSPKQIEQVDAKIKVSAEYSPDGGIIRVTAVWEGGSIAGITKALFADADSRWMQKRTGLIFIDKLILEVVDMSEEVYFVKQYKESS